MKVYLVRHGETAENVARRHQREESPINEHGKAQAAALAKRIVRLRPTHLIVSTRIRALETGQAIAAATDLIPETSELFVELCRPRFIYGVKRNHPRSLWYLLQWYTGRIGGQSCDDTGESYDTFRRRLAAAQEYLTTLPPDAVVVVITHAVFINFFLAHLTDKRPLSPLRAPGVLFNIFKTKNASVLPLCYEAGVWRRLGR